MRGYFDKKFTQAHIGYPYDFGATDAQNVKAFIRDNFIPKADLI